MGRVVTSHRTSRRDRTATWDDTTDIFEVEMIVTEPAVLVVDKSLVAGIKCANLCLIFNSSETLIPAF